MEHVQFPFTDYHLIVDVSEEKIAIFEEETGGLLETLIPPAPLRLKETKKKSRDELQLTGEDGKFYSLWLRAMKVDGTFPTEGFYIFSVHLLPEWNLGAYFGFYEWGLFQLQEKRLNIVYSEKAAKLTAGILAQDKNRIVIVTSFLDGRIEVYEIRYSLSNSGFTGTPERLWEVKNNVGVSTLGIIDNYLVSGHKDGSLKVWGLKTGEQQQHLAVTDSQVHCLDSTKTTCFIGTANGTALAFDIKTWRLLWQRKLSEKTLLGVNVVDDLVGFVENGFTIYWLSPVTGDVHLRLESETGVASRPVRFKNWHLVAGSAALLLFAENQCFETLPLGDNLIRAICLHQQGVITGNDSGELTLWSYPGVAFGEIYIPSDENGVPIHKAIREGE
ncbi:MAG: hypothetical protein ACFFGZ_14355 [Candidatus Thorarchaeota archaeon]